MRFSSTFLGEGRLALAATGDRAVLSAIGRLAENPFPRQSLKLKGMEQLHRLRAGNYRIVYKVDPAAKRIVIQHIRHRRDVYRKL